MTPYEAMTLYAGLFVILFIGLKLNAGRVRAGTKVNFGEGGNDKMIQAMRVQANAVEDVPIVLIGLFGLAALSAPVMLIHGLGGSYLAARVLHALGLGRGGGTGRGRMIGTLVTLIVMLVTAGACLFYALT